MLGLPLGLAFFPAFGFALARLMWSPGPMRIFALAFGLGVSEWLRALALTGFPWNDIGMSLGDNIVLAQIASVVGLHGLTFFAIAIFAAPATLWRPEDGRLRLAPTALAALALALIAGLGFYRLDTPASPTVPKVKLRIVQPNVSQGRDFSSDNKEALLERYFSLSDRATAPDRTGVADVTHLIWPESAFPFILSRDATALAEITEFLHGGAVLLTGAARAEEGPDRRLRFFNSIVILDRGGLSSERYDKRHLVPFGEYLPFASLFERAHITQFVHVPGGFDAGVGRALLRAPGLPEALPMVCYEAIFPNEIGAVFSSAARPGWMLNVTDDAWFGITPGPYQHFAQARLRSIELGLPMVRAANSGVSAVIDGYGRTLVSAPLGAEGVLDASLPKALRPDLAISVGFIDRARHCAGVSGPDPCRPSTPLTRPAEIHRPADVGLHSQRVDDRVLPQGIPARRFALDRRRQRKDRRSDWHCMNKAPNDSDRSLGSRVRSRRLELGLSQGALGERIGVSFQQIQKYESGAIEISAQRLGQIADALQTSIAYLYEELASPAALKGFGMAEEAAWPYSAPPVSAEEGRALNSAFFRIRDPQVRKSIIDLVNQLANSAPHGRKSDEGVG